jgi:hypothetical protein
MHPEPSPSHAVSWVVRAPRPQEALPRLLPQRRLFSHRFHVVPKCGPDALKVFSRLGRSPTVDASWQLLVYADPELWRDLPGELHFDPELNWHQQHLGRPGLVATANLLVEGSTLYSAVHLSDLVQRISRRRELKTRVEKRFKRWHYVLLNAIANVAVQRGVRTLRTPTATAVLATMPRFRHPQPAMFQRIYDGALLSTFRATQDAGWWTIDVADNRDRIILAERTLETIPGRKTIAICHDIEAGMGHPRRHPLRRSMDALFPAALERMLDIENRAGVRATYHIVGCLLSQTRRHLDTAVGGPHALAFHSFDHTTTGGRWRTWAVRAMRGLVSRDAIPFDYQLARCRIVDYRLKGYRPPQSVIAPGLTAQVLASYNFEWLASSARSLNTMTPAFHGGIAWLPIMFDDYVLHRQRCSYETWEQRALEAIRQYPYVALSLHDCYAPLWIERYAELLHKVSDLGTLRTLDEVAADLALTSAS